MAGGGLVNAKYQIGLRALSGVLPCYTGRPPRVCGRFGVGCADYAPIIWDLVGVLGVHVRKCTSTLVHPIGKCLHVFPSLGANSQP